ncbi:NAD-dependent protein deacylase [Bombilactobacillus bombi]|uniref:protein acetyllysine N-acetyltransferase n=1 Tax=Bombilactobacillus bombi TaxID=1303590 RepID=A0A3R6V777_9LACO|nr:NAD-dependent protein deacylase [Bombilactobacillus bombi]RHW47784.1 NAD-dependent protein deacylase [Bombilactobacillus bombi]
MKDLNQALQQAQYVVFMTGAGVSTASGIPDYRSETGVYAGKHNAEYMLSHDNFIQHPADYWHFVQKNLYFPEAQPNIIHQKMAQIANQKGCVITQNVDGLDRKAGCQNLIEFHGTLYDIYCTKCGQAVDWHEYRQDYRHQNCGGIIRSSIVLYGESINENHVSQSLQAVAQADLIVVVGTSFQVYPFAGLIQYRQPQAQLIAVNKTPLSMPNNGEMILDDAVKVFEEVQV